jgi:hypothetical protein
MKVLVLLLILAAPLTTLADVVVEIIEQNLELPAKNGGMLLKCKGDQLRVDVTGSAERMSAILNVKTGEMLSLLHTKKKFVKLRPDDVKRQTEVAHKAAGFDPPKAKKAKATGIVEKIGEWEAEIFEFDAGGATGRLWAAREFPNAQALNDAFKMLSVMNSTGFDPQAMGVPGSVVKSEMKTPDGLLTATLAKCVVGPVPDSEFIVPGDYEEIKAPNAKPTR